jgi:prolipoprotein diacylglyceryltransferase
MALFAALYVVRVLRDDRYWIANGFYLAVGFYGAQRFVWEFLKPYGPLVGPFTLFHLLSAALVVYAVVMIATAPSACFGEAYPDREWTRARRKEHALSEPADFVTGVEKRH